MAKSLIFNYTFSPSTDSIAVDGNVSQKRVLLVTNLTDNIILYNFADTSKKIISRSYNASTDETTFVFQYDCSAMSATDTLQIFIEQDATKFEPSDTYQDPVSKFRVSQPNTLIDTDFEYGLQATKWETVERLNDVPAFHSIANDTPLTGIVSITTVGTKIVTVTTSTSHGFVTGTPIDVRGVDSASAEGTFIVKRTTDTAFSYEAKAVQGGNTTTPVNLLSPYTTITGGRFYVGAQVLLDNTAANTDGPITTNAGAPAQLTVRTEQQHGFANNSQFYLVNTLSNTFLNFNPVTISNSSGEVDDRQTLAGTGAVFTATIATTNLTISAMTSGVVSVGMLVRGAGVTEGTIITGFTSGTFGGAGVYTLSKTSTVGSGVTMTGTNYSTGYFLPSEPFHVGTVRREITQAGINISTHVITVPAHGLALGDRIAYVGTSSGGSAPQVNANVSANFAFGAGPLPSYSTTNGRFLYVGNITTDTFKLFSSPKDAYATTNPMQFNGIGSGTHTFVFYKRGVDFITGISSIASTSGSPDYTVSLSGNNTNISLNIWPKQQITISGSDVSSLNGVYIVSSTSYSPTGTSFVMTGPTDTSGINVNAGSTQTYSIVNSGGNGSTTFNRWDYITTIGIRAQLHNDPAVNATRVAYHDWKAKTTKFFGLQDVPTGSDRIYIKNHGLVTGEPVVFGFNGQAWSGGTNPPVANAIYFVSRINADEIELYTNETATGSGPYSPAIANLKINFSAVTTLAGGLFSLHPGMTVATFTSQTVGATGQARDRVICLFQNVPAWVREGQAIILRAGSGSTLPTPVVNTPDTFTSYQKYYIRNVFNQNSTTEFSLSITPTGPLLDFTGATTAGSAGTTTAGGGRFFVTAIDENLYSNSFYLENHGGFATNRRVGGTVITGLTTAYTGQGVYPQTPDYPGPLFDKITDATGQNWPRVRTYLSQQSAAQLIQGLTLNAQYYMVPIDNNTFKLQAYSTSVLPSGNPTVQITGIVPGAAAGEVAFSSPFVQNQYANRIVVATQNQLFTENAVVRYENRGGVDIGSGTVGFPGLVNNKSYIVRNVVNDIAWSVSGLLSAATSTATSLTITTAVGLNIGDTIKVGNEYIYISNIVSQTLTVIRGFRGTTAGDIQEATAVEKLYGSFQLFDTTQGAQRTFSTGAADATNDFFTLVNHNLRTGDTVAISSTAAGTIAAFGGVAISLVGASVYYALVYNNNEFALAFTPALAYAQYPLDITAAGTAWTFVHYYSSIPLQGLASSTVGNHTLEDVSSTGTLDGGYQVVSTTATTFNLATNTTVPVREFKFEPADYLNMLTGEFIIPNHGYITGGKVTYSKGALVYAIGEGLAADVPPSGYNALTNNAAYYTIRTGIDSFQLATTKANALANIPIRRYATLGSTGAHTFTSSLVYGESLAQGLATIVARDVVVNGSLNTVVSAASDRIISTAHGLITGDRVTYRVWAGGRVINGLVDGRQYFVNNSVNTGPRGGAQTGQSANQFSLHNSWVGSYTNSDLVDMSGVGSGTVHQFKVSNPTLVGTFFKGEWNAADTYIYGDMVIYNGMYWMSLVNANVNFVPVALTTGLDNLAWMRAPTLQNYSTRFLVSYRGGDNIKLSNQLIRRTLIIDGSSASRVITADNRINFATAHNLKTGDAVRYNISAPGGSHQGAAPATGAYSNFVGTTGVPQTPIGGLVANRTYYVNVQGSTDITLHDTLAGAIEGGSGDTGNFVTAVNLTAVGTGTIHRFDLIENVTYTMNILSVTNDREMIVSDPYPAKSIQFNPQGSFTTVANLITDTVDIPENEIYIANHGLDTCVKVYYSVGPVGSGTAMGGLVDGTAYYVIKSDEDSFALATTVTNALLNIRIDITSTGTGFQHYFIAATAAGSSQLRYDNAGAFTTTAPSGTLYYTGQIGANIRDGVLTALPIIQETQVYVRPDCINVHRPFDGGVEINASTSPGVSITRQTRKYFRYQSGKGLQYSTGINFSPSIDVARITHDGTTYATVKTRRPHRLTVNSKIMIENVEAKDEYTAVKCERDLAYFIDGVRYDITLGTNYNAVFLGLAEVNTLDFSATVVTAINNTKTLVAALPNVAASATATSRSNAFFTEVLDIATNGRANADAVTFTNPGTATASQIAAKDRIAANKAFIAAEINAWIAGTYPTATHDVAKCTRDVGYALNALAYDILYGGNSATVQQAAFFFYFDSSGVSGIYTQDKTQTVAAYNRLQAIISQVVQNQAITGGFGNPSGKSTGNALTQDTTGTAASAGDGSILQTLVQITEDVINSDSQLIAISGLPAIVYPNVAWALDELETAKTAIEAAKDSIIANVVRGAPYSQPAGGGEYFVINNIIDDFTFRYATNGVPINLAPSGFPSLFVHSWTDAVVRAGVFDDQNGIFYEYDGKHLNAVRRSSTAQLGGTASSTSGSRKLTGTDTNWTKQLRAGDRIVVRGQPLKVVAVISDTEIHFQPTYRGSSRSGIVITKTLDLKIPSYRWNKDTCDGNGPTGFNLNIHRMQMAYVDYSWYGAGKVRYGFKGPDGKVFYAHELIHNNVEIEAYMRSGNLPARYQIENGAAPTFAPSLYHWGASMIMDGGFEDDKAYLFTVASGSAGNDTVTINQALAGSPVPILSLRLAPSVDSGLVGALGDRDIINRMQIALDSVGVVVSNATSRPASFRLVLNGALAQQAYFANYGSPSLTQIIKHTGAANDTVVGGTTLFEFRALATVTGNVTAQDLSQLVEIGNSLLGGDYVFPNGPDVITLVCVPTDTTAATAVTARFTWKESQA